MNATFAPARPDRGERRVPVAVGRARHRDDEPGRRARHRHLAVRLGRQQGRRQWQRPPAVLGRRRADRGHPALPRVVRKPGQVRAARPQPGAYEAHRRGEERAHRGRQPRRVVAHGRARVAPTSRSTRSFARPASFASTRSTSCSRRRWCSPTNRIPAGRRVAIVGNAGGPGILAADACAGAGLEVAEFAPATQERAARDPRAGRHGAAIPSISSPAQPRRSSRVHSGSSLADPAIDAVLAIFVPPLVTQRRRRRPRDRERGGDRTGQATARVLPRPGRRSRAVARRRAGGARSRRSRFPESAAHAFGRVADLGDWRRRPPGVVPDLDGIDLAGARDDRRDRVATPNPKERGWISRPRRFCSRVSAYRRSHRVKSRIAREARRAAHDIGFPGRVEGGCARARAQERRRRRRARPTRRSGRRRRVRRDVAVGRTVDDGRDRAADGRRPASRSSWASPTIRPSDRWCCSDWAE